jgi:hypothetical protein
VEEIERSLVEGLSSGSIGGAVAAGNPTLAGGLAGLALFFAYLDAARPGSDAGERALDVLGRSIDGLSTWTVDPSLYSGFCGVGWVVAHLTRELFEGDEDQLGAIDEVVAGLLAGPEPMPYELVRGVSGFGTYLVERLPDPGAAVRLGRVLDRLEATAEDAPDGRTWFTLPAWEQDRQRGVLPDGCYNLGVAHGVPGVLGLLASARREGFADPRLAPLADQIVRWLLAQRLPAGGNSVFPAYFGPGAPPQPARTAWCYGDLGIAAVLLSAARSFGRPDWEDEALALARLAATRSEEAAGALDACLCHGTAGNAHLLLRLHHATGDPILGDAALEWLGRTLEHRRPGEAVAGFPTWLPELAGDGGEWYPDPGFLMGAAGVGLALLAAVSDVEPAWDRVMLISVPPGPGQEDDRR